MTLEEEILLIKKAKKDPKTFGKIFDEYYPQIYGYVLRRLADVHLANDITAEVFYKALKNLWQFTWKNISISAWLYRIATNEINHNFRDKGRKSVSVETLTKQDQRSPEVSSDLEAEIIEAERVLQQNENLLLIQKAMQTLDIKYQEVISLKYFEGKKIKEISKILKKKEGTIKSLLSRGINQLKELC